MARVRTPVIIAHRDASVTRELGAMLDPERHVWVGRADSADELRSLTAQRSPAVALVELRILLELAVALRRPCGEHVAIVVIAKRADEQAIEAATRMGSAGYLVLPCSAAQLHAAVGLARTHEPGAPDSTPGRSGTHRIGLSGRDGDGRNGRDGRRRRALSAREHEICEYLSEGQRVADIAARLFISPHTVRKHAQSIFRKLGVHSQIELMGRQASRAGTGRARRITGGTDTGSGSEDA